jgi:F420-0:gamma-glutamyl ligase
MQIIAIKSVLLKPPRADLFIALEIVAEQLQPTDIVVITSKVVSIHQGRCVKIDQLCYTEQKKALIHSEADVVVPLKVTKNLKVSPLTKKNNIWIGSAGIDESNGDGYFILWPQNPEQEAKNIYEWLRVKKGFANFGVLITDTNKRPFRLGAIGFALAHYGFQAITSYVGNTDLFGRHFKNERINQADALAAAAVHVMGEGNEGTPFAFIRSVHNITFTPSTQILTPESDMDYFSGLINENFNK